MTSTTSPGKLRLWPLAVLGLIGAVISPAQTVTNPETTPPEKKPEDVVVLSPFVVTTQQEDSYTAHDTLAGNRTRTNLSDVGSSIQVVTKKFLNDTDSKRAEDLLVLMTNVEVSGQGGNFIGKGDGGTLATPPSFQPITRVRGLDAADTTQDFFLTRIPFDSYNVGRVDIQRGPNSILFGIGKPGGIINATVNDALFSNSYKIENEVSSFGGVRWSADLNQVLIPHELAVKVAALDDDTKYRQEPAFRDDKRIYGALRWEPEFLNRGSSHTTLLVRTEHGRISANAPMETPPDDAITAYFTDPSFKNPNGTLKTYTPNQIAATPNPWATVTNPTAVTAYEANGNQGKSFYAFPYHWPDKSASDVDDPNGAAASNNFNQIQTYGYFANNNPAMPFQDVKPYKAKSLSDPSIFNFYDQLFYGPNAGEDSRFDTYTLDLAQTFFNGQVGLDLSYNKEASRYSNLSFGYSAALAIDIMSQLPDGEPNPNVGRPYFSFPSTESGTSSFSDEKRETARLTGFAELDFKKYLGRDSLWAKILGRHVFTGLLDRYTIDSDTRSYGTDFIADDPSNWFGSLDAAGASSKLVYLGPNINKLTSPSGLNLGRITGNLQYGPTTLNLWNNVEGMQVISPMTVVDNTLLSEASRKYASANLLRNEIDSKVITWQAYLFDGLLVPLIGYRTDKEESYTYTAQPIPTLHAGVDVNPQVYKLPSTAATTDGHSNTYSVVAHLPSSLSEKLPWHLGISPFYNQSENFQPSAGRIDPFGNRLPDPKGLTKEYGVTINALNDKVVFRFTHFDTRVTDVNVAGAYSPGMLLMFPIAYGEEAYLAMTNPTRGSPTSYNAFPTLVGMTSDGKQDFFIPSGAAPYTQAQIDEQYAIQTRALAAWGANVAPKVPQSVLNTWGLAAIWNNPDTYTGRAWSDNPNVTVTSDTESTGTEWELSATPISGLSLSANLAHTEATVTQFAKSYTDFIALLDQLLSGDAGLVRIWRGSDQPYTARGVYDAWKSNYTVLKASEGRQSPEIRPWRFNGTADYTIQTGRLKGVHFGGSYRWEDRAITGYPLSTVDGGSVYDVDHPYRGSTNSAVDLWVGYHRNLTKKIKWKTQLNARNVFASDKLQVATVEPDGTPAGLRIPEPRVIYWTNTFEF